MPVINGTPGPDALNGTMLGDQINGGDGADVIRGFGGADTLDGGAGADRFLWNAGDGSDRVEGGADGDTGFFVGDAFLVSAGAGHALVTNLAETVDLHGVETLNLHGLTTAASFAVGDLSATDVRQVVIGLAAQAGANAIAVTGGPGADVIEAQALNGATLRVFDTVGDVVQTTVISNLDTADRVTVDGGTGNDVITITTPAGLASPALIAARGGAGDDSLTGSLGNELLLGDAGDDLIVSGGGADSIDGGAGADIQRITGSDGVDTVALSASAGHLRETVGGVTSDVTNVEVLTIRPLGQGDTVAIGDLTSTSVRTVNVDLSAARGGQDGAADTVTLPGSFQTGLSPFVSTVSLTSALDGSSLQALYAANGAVVETINLTALGATDVVKLAGGDGDDIFSITNFASHRPIQVDGGLGRNFLLLGATAGNDVIDVAANAGHLNVTMNGLAPLDLINIKAIAANAGAGADTVRISDLGGSADRIAASIDLSGFSGAPDGQADTVNLTFTRQSGEILIGSQFGDLSRQDFTVQEADSHDRSNVVVDGLDAQDHVVVNLVGDGPFEVRGPFNQTDFHLGSGDNTLNWRVDKVGHDSVDGGAGSDALDIGFAPFLRAIDHGAWSISLSAAGETSKLGLHHAFDLRTPGVIDLAVDLTHVERLSLSGGGAGDFILIGDQSGTGVKHVDIDVGPGGPDQERDLVFLDGTSGADSIFVAQTSGDVTVNGLPASAKVRNLDSSDHVFIRAGAGNDLIDLSNHNPGRGVVHLDSGLGSDTMIGGFGAESFELHGGAGGQDVVVGFRGHVLGGEADVVSVFSTTDHSFADLLAHRHIFQSGANVVVTDGAGAFLTLASVNLASLSASDFVF